VFTRFQRFYNSIKLLADMGALAAAFGLAYLTRFSGLLAYESQPPLACTLMRTLPAYSDDWALAIGIRPQLGITALAIFKKSLRSII
jgi:hypothetical protein